MSARLLIAGSMAAAASWAAHADDLKVSKFRHAQTPLAAIFVCPGTVAPSDCDAGRALQSIVDPPWARDVGCGVGSQAVLAGSGLRLVEGQYVKVVCVHETSQAD